MKDVIAGFQNKISTFVTVTLTFDAATPKMKTHSKIIIKVNLEILTTMDRWISGRNDGTGLCLYELTTSHNYSKPKQDYELFNSLSAHCLPSVVDIQVVVLNTKREAVEWFVSFIWWVGVRVTKGPVINSHFFYFMPTT